MNQINRLLTLIAFLLGTATLTANGQPTSYPFALHNTQTLYADIYQPVAEKNKHTCVLYMFGGGFVAGSRTETENVRFFNDLVNKGYTVVAIDYRLGLKGVGKVSPFAPKAAFRAVEMATEDLIAATRFLIDNATKLQINPKRIVLVGSSAGAITALQADYELANRTTLAASLPADFRYAGVVSLAGAIFSTQGRPKYAEQPAPTLLYHGTKDKIVAYNKIKLFKRGMFGTKTLADIFEKNNFPYMVVRYEELGHEVAEFPRFEVQEQICTFIDAAAAGQYRNAVDVLIKDRAIQSRYSTSLKR